MDFLCYVIDFIHNILKCLLMYSLRLFLKSFFMFFLISCQSNLPAQEVSKAISIEKPEVTKQKSIVVGAEQLDLLKQIVGSKRFDLGGIKQGGEEEVT